MKDKNIICRLPIFCPDDYDCPYFKIKDYCFKSTSETIYGCERENMCCYLYSQLKKQNCENCEHKLTAKNILNKPNCNDCDRKDCEFKPEFGHIVRFNCPLWIGKGTTNE